MAGGKRVVSDYRFEIYDEHGVKTAGHVATTVE